jgi:hypothetical protein
VLLSPDGVEFFGGSADWSQVEPKDHEKMNHQANRLASSPESRLRLFCFAFMAGLLPCCFTHSARLIRGTARLSDACRLLHTPAPPPPPRGAALGVLGMEGVDASGGDPVGGRAIGCSFTEPSGRAGLSGKEMSSPLEGDQSSR